MEVEKKEVEVKEEIKEVEKKETKALSQEEVDKIIEKRLAKERAKAEKEKEEALKKKEAEERAAKLTETQKLKEELDLLKKERELEKKQKIKDEKRFNFKKRMLDLGVSEDVSSQLLESVSVDKMENFNLEPFKKAGMKSVTINDDVTGKEGKPTTSIEDIAKYL